MPARMPDIEGAEGAAQHREEEQVVGERDALAVERNAFNAQKVALQKQIQEASVRGTVTGTEVKRRGGEQVHW